MISTNFYRYVDKEGKIPFLSETKRRVRSHPYYVRYANNKPVAFKGPLEVVGTRLSENVFGLYDYSKQTFVTSGFISE